MKSTGSSWTYTTRTRSENAKANAALAQLNEQICARAVQCTEQDGLLAQQQQQRQQQQETKEQAPEAQTSTVVAYRMSKLKVKQAASMSKQAERGKADQATKGQGVVGPRMLCNPPEVRTTGRARTLDGEGDPDPPLIGLARHYICYDTVQPISDDVFVTSGSTEAKKGGFCKTSEQSMECGWVKGCSPGFKVAMGAEKMGECPAKSFMPRAVPEEPGDERLLALQVKKKSACLEIGVKCLEGDQGTLVNKIHNDLGGRALAIQVDSSAADPLPPLNLGRRLNMSSSDEDKVARDPKERFIVEKIMGKKKGWNSATHSNVAFTT
jgi:hypothetical protein